MIFIIIYIYSYVYLCMYTPSYQHFKAFSVSNFNSEISFLYQLFKENSNCIVKKSCKVIRLIFMMSLFFIFIYTYILTQTLDKTREFCHAGGSRARDAASNTRVLIVRILGSKLETFQTEFPKIVYIFFNAQDMN